MVKRVGDKAKKNPVNIADLARRLHTAYKSVEAKKDTSGIEENLDANQQRVGQLGPTELVKNNNIGKLVGANESTNNDELYALKKLMGK